MLTEQIDDILAGDIQVFCDLVDSVLYDHWALPPCHCGHRFTSSISLLAKASILAIQRL